MNASAAQKVRRPTRHYRIASQWAMFALWFGLVVSTQHPMDGWLAKLLPVSLFLRADPLVLTVVSGGMRMMISILLLGFVTLGVSLLLGRVFCGWVCPLGSIFDFYGWFLRKFRVPFEGPSPKWFRLKYYILAALLLFSLLGTVSPLMGLDPIVIITRVAAAVLNPLWRKHADLHWSPGSTLGSHGWLIDGFTLLLFMLIMSATTRLSRIWCRTACPLGAYLAVASRNSALRRNTKNCIQCGICAIHCPTGAIDFKDATIYNESECVKCFLCTEECPVDANFFELQSPLKAFTPSHHPVQLERRGLITAAAVVVASAPVLKLAGGEPRASKSLIRPPMSREENDFLLSCIRCNECSKACPTGILKPAHFEQGLRAFWSPVMVPSEGYCMEGCNACSQACPTDAITKYAIDDKYLFKSGTAVFESSRCISHTEGKFCSECVRVCPTDAIEISRGWEPEGERPEAGTINLPFYQTGIKQTIGAHGSEALAPAGKTPTRPVHVNFDRCVGCGACEHACDQIVFGEPAMVTTSYGRATPTRFTQNTAEAQ